MLPTIAHVPGGALLLAGGLLACFAGYRLFKIVLGVYGFIIGALLATSLVSPGHSTAFLIAAILGGIAGAVLLTMAYFLSVALVGAGLGAMLAHTVWPHAGYGAPTALVLLAFGLGGAVLAIFFQRYVIIAGTAFGGAWTVMVGAAALSGSEAAMRAAHGGSAWRGYPIPPRLDAPLSGGGFSWIWLAWLVLSVAGLAAQLKGKKK